MSEVLVASKVVTSTGVHAPGWVRIDGEMITAVGAGDPASVQLPTQRPTQSPARPAAQRLTQPPTQPPTAPAVQSPAQPAVQPPAQQAETVRDLGDVTLVPGFVDAHVHGGGGSSYPEISQLSARAALESRRAHLARGTTSTMASLVTAQPDELLEQVRALAPLVADGTLRGIHLEGPWLSPARKGAHDERALRQPDLAEINALLEAAQGAIRMVTIAPELPGALAAISRFAGAGVVVAIGHTDADFDEARRGIDAGATVATHLFNAMPPLLHRAPGPVLALLEDERVTLELVADGVHLHPELVRWVERAAGLSRIMLVTDAMGAAACGDGSYQLGALDVSVEGGVAKIAGTDTIAGSTATMDALFRGRAILEDAAEVTGAGPGVAAGTTDASLVAAVRMTSTTPARAMGWADVGDIAPGKRADLVVLDARLQVREVMLGGARVEAGSGA